MTYFAQFYRLRVSLVVLDIRRAVCSIRQDRSRLDNRNRGAVIKSRKVTFDRPVDVIQHPRGGTILLFDC